MIPTYLENSESFIPRFLSMISLSVYAGSRRILMLVFCGSAGGQYRAVLEIMAFDRSRLLLDVSKVVAEYHLNIISSSSTTSGARIVRMVFDVELADPTHLSSLLAALKGVDGVFDAFRQLPGQNKTS